uniref:Protein MIX23 n=1 Tax=Phallusia mammillata TaxID=59560 RepID=A0A6F9D8T6_9ASCI|nr:coiled-coil domain-containing protein 58-like [Phallusia mammillata]
MDAPMITDTKLCADFSIFMNALKNSRTIDDRIVQQLNSVIPTQSFSEGINISAKCKDLYELMQSTHLSRVTAIKQCISMQTDRTKDLAGQKQADPENFQIRKKLSKEQGTLRLFQQEMNIEEIVQQRAQKVFYERCRDYYQPES